MNPLEIADDKAKQSAQVARWQLLACTVVVVLTWCLVLPRVGQLAAVRAHIEAMEKRDINVGAMFYSELNWQPPTGAAWR